MNPQAMLKALADVFEITASVHIGISNFRLLCFVALFIFVCIFVRKCFKKK